MLASMRTITLNEKQRRRWEIVTRLIARKISSTEASELLGRSSRQVRRIRQRYEAEGLQIKGRTASIATIAERIVQSLRARSLSQPTNDALKYRRQLLDFSTDRREVPM
jgi:hypothetical protein